MSVAVLFQMAILFGTGDRIEDIETKYIKIKNDEKIDFGIPESSNSGLPYLDGDE